MYSNPAHPFDLSLSDLNELRLKFEEAKQLSLQNNTSEAGITLDYLSQLLAEKLSEEPSKIQKYLRRMTQFKTITWNQFLELLDVESDLRAELLDWHMYEIKTKMFVEYQRKILKPLNRQTDRIYYIEKMYYMEFNGANYMLLVFDDSTISIFEMAHFQCVVQFKIPYEFTMEKFIEQEKGKINKIIQKNLVYEKKEKPGKEQQDSRKRANSNYDQSYKYEDNVLSSQDPSTSIGKRVRMSSALKNSNELSLDQSMNVTFNLKFNSSSGEPPKNIQQSTSVEIGEIQKKPELDVNKDSKMKLAFQSMISKHLNFFQRIAVIRRVLIFIKVLKERIKKKPKIQYQEDYLSRNKEHIHKMFQAFKVMPIEETSDFCSKYGKMINEKRIHTCKIEEFNNLIKNAKSSQARRLKQSDNSSLIDEKLDVSTNEKLRKIANKEEKIEDLKRELNWMTRAVDFNPRTLKSRSTDPKNQNIQQRPKTTPKVTLQQYMEERKKNKNKPNDPNQKKLKKRNMFVTALSYCTENGLLFIGLVNQEIQIFKFGINEKNSTHYIKKLDIIKGQDIPKAIEITRHRIKKNLICITLFQNNIIRIYKYDYQSKAQQFTLDQSPVYTFNIGYEASCLKFYDGLGIALSSYKGEFSILMDHFIKVPNANSMHKKNLSDSQEDPVDKSLYDSKSHYDDKKSPDDKDHYFYPILKRKLDTNEGLVSITCLTYSQLHKKLVFGSLKGKVTFFNFICNEIISVKNSQSTAQVLEIYAFDEQNQVVSICSDFTVYIWDIARQQIIQSFKTIKDISEDFHYEIHTTQFLEKKGILYTAGNTLQSWIGVNDRDRAFKKMKVESIYYWRNRQNEKSSNSKQKKVNNGDELYRTLYRDEKKKRKVPANIFVKRKHPEPSVRIQFIQTSADSILLFDSTKHIKVFSSKSLRLNYSFLFEIEESIDQITSFSATEDLSVVGYSNMKQEVKILNLYSQKLLQSTEMPGHISYLSFLKECEYYFLVGQEDGHIFFCTSFLKGSKKLQNKRFNIHKKPLVCLEKNDQYLVSVSEDFNLCIWSLTSCSLKKQLLIPSPSLDSKNESMSPKSLQKLDESKQSIIIQYLPCMIQFIPDKSNRFLLVTNGGDMHEYSASEGVLIQAFTCQLGIFNGLGQICFKPNNQDLLSVDAEGKVKLWSRVSDKILKGSRMPKFSSPQLRKNASIVGSPLRAVRGGTKRSFNSDFKLDDHLQGWNCTKENELGWEESTLDMIPVKIIYHKEGELFYVFSGILKMYMVEESVMNSIQFQIYKQCELIGSLTYETNKVRSFLLESRRSDDQSSPQKAIGYQTQIIKLYDMS